MDVDSIIALRASFSVRAYIDEKAKSVAKHVDTIKESCVDSTHASINANTQKNMERGIAKTANM